MKALRIVFIVTGWLLIVADILNNLANSHHIEKYSLAYLTGYLVGGNLLLIAGVVFLFLGYFIKRKLNAKQI